MSAKGDNVDVKLDVNSNLSSEWMECVVLNLQECFFLILQCLWLAHSVM